MQNLMTDPSSSILIYLIGVLLIWLVMYLARTPFHRSMESFGRLIYNSMRLAASSVKLAEQRLRIRNQEVLLSAGLEMAERKVEREFDRISSAVIRDMEGYPQVQRKLNEDLHKLEEDYENCTEIPQTLPDWVKVIEAISNIKPTGDRMVVNMLEEIHQTLNEQHKSAVERHRRDVAERHNILSRMLPLWRGIQKRIVNVEKSISELIQRSKKIDRYMADYEKIRTQTDMAERQLSSSSLTQFFISGVVLAVAVVGAIINFNLVALPMSEMVGGNSYIGAFRTSDVAGMFIVCCEMVLGFFVMDALRITRLFSIIGSMEDNKRRAIFWILFSFLFVLACVESSLAFMRDRIAADMEALRQSLAGIETDSVVTSKIPMIGQMIMGFILPFILTFVAIPFESFVSSSRTVIGLILAWGLRALAFLFRLVGNIGFYLSRLIVNLFDILVSPILWVENKIALRKSNTQAQVLSSSKTDAGEGKADEKKANVSPLKEKASENKEATA